MHGTGRKTSGGCLSCADRSEAKTLNPHPFYSELGGIRTHMVSQRVLSASRLPLRHKPIIFICCVLSAACMPFHQPCKVLSRSGGTRTLKISALNGARMPIPPQTPSAPGEIRTRKVSHGGLSSACMPFHHWCISPWKSIHDRTHSGSRTHTCRILSAVPLPLGYVRVFCVKFSSSLQA